MGLQVGNPVTWQERSGPGKIKQEIIEKKQGSTGFSIITRTIVVIIDYDWVDYFLYFFVYISFVFL